MSEGGKGTKKIDKEFFFARVQRLLAGVLEAGEKGLTSVKLFSMI